MHYINRHYLSIYGLLQYAHLTIVHVVHKKYVASARGQQPSRVGRCQGLCNDKGRPDYIKSHLLITYVSYYANVTYWCNFRVLFSLVFCLFRVVD